MIVRIVRLTFKEESVADFLRFFDQIGSRIRRREGCHYLELLKDPSAPNIFITYSLWESEAHLQNYIDSDTFKEIWTETKKLFADRPMAFSMKRYLTVE